MLRQRQIVVRDALITWDDDLRNAPQLVLDRVQFRLENRFGRHRFGLRGTPPAELAAPIDLRGDCARSSRTGRTREGRCSCASTTPTSRRGANGCRCRADLAAGRARCASGSNSRGRTARARRRPRARRRQGEAGDGPARTRARASFGPRRLAKRPARSARSSRRRSRSRRRTASGSSRPTSRLTCARAGRAHGVRADRVRSAAARASRRVGRAPAAAGAHPRRSRALRAARDADAWPHALGRTAEAPTSFTAAAEFTDLGLVAQDALPGITGSPAASRPRRRRRDQNGRQQRNARPAPRLRGADRVRQAAERRQMGAPRRHDEGEARAARVRQRGRRAAARPGTYRTMAQGPGEIDIIAHASRGDARQVHRYLPRAIDEATRHWLARRSSAASASMRGSRCRKSRGFSFCQRQGRQVHVHHEGEGGDARLRATAGRRSKRIDADVRIDGTRMTIDAARGRVNGVEIGKTHVEIADISPRIAARDRRRSGGSDRRLPALRRTRVPSRRASADQRGRRGHRQRPAGAEDRAAARAARGHQGRRANSRSPRRSCASPACRCSPARRQGVVYRSAMFVRVTSRGDARRTGEALGHQ